MARAPLLQLSDIRLSFGKEGLIDGASLVVQPGDRIALVGRNGCGKSTLMRVMAGLLEPDSGARVLSPGTHIGFMEQDPDLAGFDTLGDFATADLPAGQEYRVEMAAEGLKFDPATALGKASGGERRRAAMARLLAQDAQVLLLDEPTNHLDIHAILWLEDHLKQSQAAIVLISHDRAFLRALTTSTLWMDRGVTRRQDKGFDAFEAWRDKTWAEEDLNRHKLDRKIKAEAKWAVEGISARRKRNQGRVRALAELRRERSDMIRRQGAAGLALAEGGQSGKRVIEAKNITKTYGSRVILKPFSLTIARGDRIALVGPNGVGKTTLVNMLTGQEAPDEGTIKIGAKVTTAMLDQNRAALMPELSLWENLTGDPDMRVSGKADQVMVRGQPRHVVSYLKEFLFTDEQARAPVRALSGGEKARLLLARIMARESNLLVLDEPTNDLDVETLDLLQDVLGDYPGTVLLVSHDRDFIDRTATMTIAMEGDGKATPYAGGWSDYQVQRSQTAAPSEARSAKEARRSRSEQNTEKTTSNGLTFTQKHRLEELPAVIERLEAEIAKLTEYLSAPDLYAKEPVKFAKASEAIAERQVALAQAEEEWLTLEDLAGGA